jgi:putative endonuclease
MEFMKTYYVYILASKSGTLYTGITSNLFRRVSEHKDHILPGFTSKYNVNRLLYYETFGTPDQAIKREKQIKGWRREKKIKLIDSTNPQWNDLAESWYDSYIRVSKLDASGG